MITICGTNNIKGALDLTGINKQLKAGDRLPVTEEEFNDHTVQIALSMKLISSEQNTMLEPDGNKSIKLRNIYDRPLRINALEEEVRPQQTFILTETQVNGNDIRGALAKGLIEIVSSARITESKEADVKVGDIFEEKEAVIGSQDEIEGFLETNEEVTNPKTVNSVEPKHVIDTETPDPVQESEIEDPKRKSVIWNPNKDPIAHTRTQMDTISATHENKEANVDVGDISFVDKEMEQEKVKEHPILKDKAPEVDDEIDFL
jgi:hypothetical protein